jgi:methyl-accepting chemotaxis protein
VFNIGFAMTVKAKMLTLLAAALIGILGLSATALFRLFKVHDSASFAAVNSLPAILSPDSASEGAVANDREIGALPVFSDPTRLSAAQQRFAANATKVDAAFKAYEPTVTDDRDKQLLANDREARQQDPAMRQKLLGLLQQGKARGGARGLSRQRGEWQQTSGRSRCASHLQL